MREAFWRFARTTAYYLGTAWAFLAAVVTILVWAALGPKYGFSDTWQLVVNTGTTIVTFLMVFIIQNTQNRDSKAMQLKLDELLRAVPGARNAFMDVEDEDLAEIVREKEIVDRDDPYPPKDKIEDGRPKGNPTPR